MGYASNVHLDVARPPLGCTFFEGSTNPAFYCLSALRACLGQKPAKQARTHTPKGCKVVRVLNRKIVYLRGLFSTLAGLNVSAWVLTCLTL